MTFPRIISDQKGTAFAEALITLPVFAAALAGIVGLNSMYSAKLEAKARARRLAWLQADSGECPTHSCRSGECRPAEAAIRTGGLDNLSHTGTDRFSVDSFLGDVGHYLFGSGTTGIGFAEAPMPNALGGGETQQRGVTTLSCNTTARSAPDGANILQHACATELRSTQYASEVCR